MLDAAALSPYLQLSGGRHYYKSIAQKRCQLKARLIDLYRLDQFNLFLLPSVRIGLGLLSQLGTNRYRLVEQEHYEPIQTLLSHNYSSVPPYLKLVTHVSPYSGHCYSLEAIDNNTIVDASHSFATIRHDELINNAKAFIAPLHKHASLTIGLAVLAIHPASPLADFFEDLLLYEDSSAHEAPLRQALEVSASKNWPPFNMANISHAHDYPTQINVISAPNLPFMCFKADGQFTHQAKDKAIRYFAHTDTFRLSYHHRGVFSHPVDYHFQALKTIQSLLDEFIKG